MVNWLTQVQKQLIWPTFNPFRLNIVDLPIKTNIMLLSSFNTSRQGNTSTLHSRMVKIEAVIMITHDDYVTNCQADGQACTKRAKPLLPGECSALWGECESILWCISVVAS